MTKQASAHVPTVMLALDRARVASRGFLRGIAQYAHLYGPWKFVSPPPVYRRTRKELPEQLKSVDGRISYVLDAKEANHFKRQLIPTIAIPVLDVSDDLISIIGDWQTTGALGAKHFLGRGFRHFAFCGYRDFIWSRKRYRAYCKALKAHGFEPQLYEGPAHHANISWEQERPQLTQWLQQLPKPVGIMACNDDRGENIIQACLLGDLHIPEEVAVLGVDNDDLLCDLADVPLSSIALNFEKAGYDAAALLDKRMRGHHPRQRKITLHPRRVITRRSTDIMAVSDTDVAEALKLIHRHKGPPLTVADITQAIPRSARSLQMRFKKSLGHSMQEEIIRVRIEQAAQLLEQTNMPVSQIAQHLGYAEPSDFNRCFRRVKNLTPLAYRKHCGHHLW